MVNVKSAQEKSSASSVGVAGVELMLTRYVLIYGTKDVWDNLVEPKLAGDVLGERMAGRDVKLRTGKGEMLPDGKQGRVTLEQDLLDYAGIDRDIVAVGVGSYWRILAPGKAK